MAAPYFELLLEFDDSGKVFRSSAFRGDAELVAQVPQQEFDAVMARVAATPGFLSDRALAKLLAESVTHPDQRSALAKFLSYFARNRSVRGDEASGYAEKVAAEILGALGDKIAADTRETLVARLPLLLAPRPAIDRQVKAEGLLRKAGRRALSLDLVSDLRPVFDESRATVEGMIPVTTLRILGPQGLMEQPFEVQLSEKQLKDLAEKTALALKKLATLKAHLNASNIVLPDSSMTAAPEDGDE